MAKLNSAARAFTLIELLVVITIIAILAGLLVPVIAGFPPKAKKAAAKNAMNAIVMALDKYREDFGTFPPDDTPSNNGSDLFYYYLCRRMKPMVKTANGAMVEGEVHCGPYLEATNTIVKSGNADGRKLISPLGGDYSYVLLVDSDGVKRNCLVVDPGEDKLLGGSLTSDRGFVGSGVDSNSDGKPDDEDNIYSTVQMKAQTSR